MALGASWLFVVGVSCGCSSDMRAPMDSGNGDGGTDGEEDRSDACVPSSELCNGLDDDCDGVVDEGCDCVRYVLFGSGGTGLSTEGTIGSIQGAIDSLVSAGETGRVCVAASRGDAGCVETTYAEAVTMAEGIDVAGAYNPASWRSPSTGCVTIIEAIADTGLLFPNAVTNETELSGFTIIGLSGIGPGVDSRAVTIISGGTLSDNVITGGNAETTTGVFVGSAAQTSHSPRIESCAITAGGGTAVVEARSIYVWNRAPTIVANVIRGGAATRLSIGIQVVGASGGVQILDNVEIQGGPSQQGIGVGFDRGDVTGSRVERNRRIEGLGGRPTDSGRGVLLQDCAGGVAVIAANDLVSGGSSSYGTGISVYQDGGTLVDIEGNVIYGLRDSESSEGGSGTGIDCGDGSRVDPTGPRCRIRSNTIVGSERAQQLSAAGVTLVVTAPGTEVRDNIITGCSGGMARFCSGIRLAAVDGVVVDGNTLLPNHAVQPTIAIEVSGSSALVTNNLVLLNEGAGIVVTRGGVGEALVHSNTIVAIPLAGSPSMSVVGGLLSGAGVWRNNLAFCLPGTDGEAFSATMMAPRILENNDFFGCSTLYGAAGTMYTTVADIHAMVIGAASNVSVDPLFVAPDLEDFHLLPSSPLIDSGSFEGAPTTDGDGDARPAGGGFDIGYDEAG